MPVLTSPIDSIAHIVLAALANSLWESAVIVLIVVLAFRLLPNMSATTRYAGWCVALALCVALPISSAVTQSIVTHAPRSVPARFTAAAIHTAVRSRELRAASSAASRPTSSSAAAWRSPRARIAIPDAAAMPFAALWLLAALLLFARLIVNFIRLEALKNDALPLPPHYRTQMPLWNAAEKGNREVRLCVSERTEVPVAVGLFDAMILLPAHLLETLSPEEIDRVALHELAHLRRGDDWSNALQRVVEAILFFNPAVLYLARQLDLEREVACDDAVIDRGESVAPYATCLTKLAQSTAWPHRPLAAPGVFVTRRGISVRIERLLRAGRNVRTSIAPGPAGALAALLALAFFAMLNVAPSYAFTQTSATPSRVASAAHARRTPSPKVTPVVRAAVHTRIVYRLVALAATPSPKPSAATIDVNVPAVNVDIPARTIHIPARHVHIRAMHFQVPMPSVPPMPKVVVQRLAGRDLHAQNLTGDFSNAKFEQADFSKSLLTAVNFSRADLIGASFRNAVLSACNFSYADLDNADLSQSEISNCDLSHARLRGSDLSRSMFTEVKFDHADLDAASMSGTVFYRCSFAGIDVKDLRERGAQIFQ